MIRRPSPWDRDSYPDSDTSLAAADWRAKRDAGTLNNTVALFPVGALVRVVCLAQDFRFFHGQTGRVTKNDPVRRYYPIEVTFDEPMRYDDGSQLDAFGFNAEDIGLLTGETQLARELRDGPRYVKAVRGARLIRENEAGDYVPMRWRARSTWAEDILGIPEGWITR